VLLLEGLNEAVGRGRRRHGPGHDARWTDLLRLLDHCGLAFRATLVFKLVTTGFIDHVIVCI